ncbi:transcriptional regulator, XRE family [Gallionella capsiferriformans ES-2]|jgi:hypothetical protein|uniref:Transcriptional regulator, XRE family n=2 Tax=Gallionella TaxID=96 RepID=D9SES2_GALCS|nr:transcriptional regulator, XRE family [Gallionella capsiferriformans ES-2]
MHASHTLFDDMLAIQSSWHAFDTMAQSYTRMTNLMKFLLAAAGDDEDLPLSGQLDLVGDLYI